MANPSITLTVPILTVDDLSQNRIKEQIFNGETSHYKSVYPETRNHPSTSTKVHPLPLQSTYNMNSVPPVIRSRPIGKIKSYKIWSILNIIFCCSCLGCFACYYSNRTEKLKQSGDIRGAFKASKTARTTNIIATLIGITIIVINVLLFLSNMRKNQSSIE